MAAPSGDEIFNELLQGMLGAAFFNTNRMTGFNRESIKTLEAVETFIPASTLMYFHDFAFKGNLPDGIGKTTLSLLQEDEGPLLSSPYSSWAPPPFRSTRSNMQERISDGATKFNTSVSRRVSLMRARLFAGLVPMSRYRWEQKKIGPQNWQPLFELMFDVVQTFLWLGDPATTKGLKDDFNFISGEVGRFGDAINARRAEQGIQTRIDMKALWLEWVSGVFETMCTRTHTWFVERVGEVVAEGKKRYDEAVDAKGERNCHMEAKKFLESWADLNRLLGKADWMCMMPLDGFDGFPSPRSSASGSKVVGSMSPMPFRDDEREELSKQIPWSVHERLLDNIEGVYTNRADMEAIIKESKENNETLRKQMRGEPKTLGQEYWIGIIKSRTAWSLSHGGPEDQTWGFVCYRLVYGNEEEWNEFLKKTEEDFKRAGEWVQGFGDVKGAMGLQWIDGREHGIAENDIEAAKRHFSTFRASGNIRKRVWALDFLVVDSSCLSSYLSPLPSFVPTETPSYGDHGGYFKMIDTLPYDAHLIAEVAPGFKNEVKVLGSLIFDDLYPLIVGMAQRPKDLWYYAMWHPMQVYVGPTVERQEKVWDEVWKAREIGTRTLWKWKREQERRSA